MNNFFLLVLLILEIFASSNAKSIQETKDVTKIELNDDISLSIANRQVSLNGTRDHVLVEMPNNSVLLSNFSSIQFVLNSTKAKDKDESDDQRDHYLVEGSKKFDEWFNLKYLDLKTNFRFFNITNPDEIIKGAKPILKELGPYEYQKVKWYENLGWEDDEKYINVKMFKKYNYIGKKDLNEKATIPNIPLLFLYNLIETKFPIELDEATKKMFHEDLKEFPMFVTHKISDLLFDGFQNKLTINFKTYESKIRFYLKDYELRTFRILKNGRFSVMGNKNNSHAGTWTINTGKDDISKIGQLYKIEGSTTSCWTSSCGEVRGTDGLINSPFISRSKSIEIFIPEHYTHIEFNKISLEEDRKFKKFTMSSNTFDSGSNYLPNKCYLQDKNDEIYKKNGILQACPDFESPIVTSNPHFLNSDFFFVKQMMGLNPNEILHSSYLKFSTRTSDLSEGKLNSQINFDTKAISKLRGIERFIFPVFWSQEQIERTLT